MFRPSFVSFSKVDSQTFSLDYMAIPILFMLQINLLKSKTYFMYHQI